MVVILVPFTGRGIVVRCLSSGTTPCDYGLGKYLRCEIWWDCGNFRATDRSPWSTLEIYFVEPGNRREISFRSLINRVCKNGSEKKIKRKYRHRHRKQLWEQWCLLLTILLYVLSGCFEWMILIW